MYRAEEGGRVGAIARAIGGVRAHGDAGRPARVLRTPAPPRLTRRILGLRAVPSGALLNLRATA